MYASNAVVTVQQKPGRVPVLTATFENSGRQTEVQMSPRLARALISELTQKMTLIGEEL